jgi:hypothetical protein
MDKNVKLPYHPHDLSYYTTWWLTSVPSTSSQTTTLSGFYDENDPIMGGRKQQVNICKLFFKTKQFFLI